MGMEVIQALPGRLQEEARRPPPLCMLWLSGLLASAAR